MTNTADNRRPQFAAEDYERRAGDLTNLPVSLTHVYAARDALRAAADLARECESLRELVEKTWRQTGGREYHNTDDELPGIVYTAFIGCERLRKRAEAAESRESELREVVNQRNAELSRRWAQMAELREKVRVLREALRGAPNAAQEFANHVLAATADEPEGK